MKRIVWFVLVLAMTMALCAPGMAAGNGETTYRALLVGVDAYEGSALSGCVNDTGRMAQALQAANEAGAFYQAPVLRANLTTEEILQLKTEMETWNVDEDDVTFFYFAGHGYMSEKGTPAIVGKDSRMLRITELIQLLDSVPGTKMVALDMRYDDGLLSRQVAEGERQKALADLNQAVISAFQQGPSGADYYVLSAATLSSSEKKAFSQGDETRGLVTYLLTQGCGYDYVQQRPTDTLPADINDNGAVSLTEARDYIAGEIAALENADEIMTDLAISPEGSTYPLLARRATSEVLEISFRQDTMEVPMGRTRQLEAVTQPPNASRRNISWTSEDLSIATVDEDGVVTGHRPGNVKIAATTANGLTVVADVNVRDIILVDALTLDKTRLTVAQGSQISLGLTVEPAEATEAIRWSTSSEAVATVTQEGLVDCVGLGDAYITVASEGGVEAVCVISVVDKADVVTGIQLKEKQNDMYVGESWVAEYRLKPENPADPEVVFTSSDPSVAEITGESIVLAVGPGNCVIKATTSSGVTGQIKIRVKGTQLHLSKESLNLKKGASVTLKTKVTPENLAGDITWESADEEVATVVNGRVTAVAAGATVITATMDSGVSAQCSVTVEGTPVKKVTVTPAQMTLEVGATAQLNSAVAPDNATLKTVTWQSSDPQVVSVDENGNVQAVSAGKAVVTATAHGGAKDKCNITVNAIEVTEVTLNLADAELVANVEGLNQIQLTAATQPAAAGNGSLKWMSSNPKVATVDATGLVTAKAPGKAVIKASAVNGKKKVNATCNITVMGNNVQNKKPIVGDEAMVYTSVRRMMYHQGYLVMEMYFVNKTGAPVMLPQEGMLTITLADGQSIQVNQVEAGKQKLKKGGTGIKTFKVKVDPNSPLYGLDLRGASAQIVTADMTQIDMGDQAAQPEAEQE